MTHSHHVINANLEGYPRYPYDMLPCTRTPPNLFANAASIRSCPLNFATPEFTELLLSRPRDRRRLLHARTRLARPPTTLQTLIRHHLTRPFRRLIHRRRHLAIRVRGRRRRVPVHAVTLTIRIGVVRIVLRRRLLVSRLLRVVRVGMMPPPHHPAEGAAWWSALSEPALCGVVAADEEEEDAAEDDGDDGVTDGHAFLFIGTRCVSAMQGEER